MSKVTVIIPVYNAERYLKKCLDSVFSQTLTEIDVIAINDGSKDNSLDILLTYQKDYKNLTVVNQENKGISIARNNGIAIAKGEYIAFLDSDDYVEKTMYEQLYQTAVESESDIIICDYYEDYGDHMDKKLIKMPQFERASMLQYPNMINDINTSPWNKLYRSELIHNNNILFPIELKYEDVVFVLQALLKANHITTISSSLINYNIREGSETKVVNERVFDIFKILDHVNDLFKVSECNPTFYMNLEYFNVRRLTIYILQQTYQKDKAVYIKFVTEAYRYLDSNYPNWRSNQIFNDKETAIKKFIKKHENLAKIVIALRRKYV